MRTSLILTLCVLFAGCSEDPRPVYGSGVWRFHDVDALSALCSEESRDRAVTGEHGDESPAGTTLVVRCAATTFDSGVLSFNLTLDDGAGDSIDVRALRFAAGDASGASPIETIPTGCESILFEVGGARYQAVCTTDEPLEGECQLEGARLDQSSSSIALDFSCHAVPTIGGGSSTCEVSGAGTSASASISFDGCSGF
jgi:hypothetical protein